MLSLLITVIIFGLLYWIVTIVPIPEPFKRVALVIVIVVFLIWLLGILFGGLAGPFPAFHPWRC